jgi:hypothetical protein
VPNSISKGYAVVKEFNTGNTWSCFDIVAAKESLNNFAEICEFIFVNIIGEVRDNVKKIRYDFKMELAKEDEKVGDVHFEFNDKFSKDELEYFGPYVTFGLLRHFNIKSVDKYHRIGIPKKGKYAYEQFGENPVKFTTGSKDNRFLFCIDKREEYGFAKIYQPQASKKK